MKKSSLMLIFIATILIVALNKLNAQVAIRGTIQDAIGKPMEFVNVMLLSPTDSGLIKGAVTAADGKYIFENITTGKYIVSATFSGMKQIYTNIFDVTESKNDVNMNTLYLKDKEEQLAKVTVMAKKPMFEQKVDRMIVNVKNSITNAGGSALDVLAKSPGVTVNRQNNSIAINGKNGVVVMINGRKSYMPMDGLLQMLSGISAGNIDKIELITTPPAKYDAEGNAGYINIVLISNPYMGTNGSYFVTAGYGKKFLGSTGANFNYRNGKINWYGNYSFDRDHLIQQGDGFTQLGRGSDVIANATYSDRDAIRAVHNLRMGLDYQLDTSTIIGALVSGYNSMWTMVANNDASIKINGAEDTSINTIDNEINHWQNIMTNLNYQHTYKAGKVLRFDANYIYYKDNNPNTYENVFYNGDKQYLYTSNVKTGKITPIHFWVFSSDYSTNIGKKITMEAGAKVSISQFHNDVSVQNLQVDKWITDTALSANYFLKENIGAAYTSFIMNVNPKTSMKFGLRYEYTSSNLSTATTANIVDRKYGQLFPTFYIAQKLNDNNTINFSYSRRITRPTYNDLAPFTIYFDPKTFFTGNPALQPAIANSVQASYVFKDFVFSLSYTYEKNTIEGFQTQKIDTINNMLFLSAKNFNYEQYITASISLPFTVTTWWTMQNNLNADWKQVNTIYNGAPVQLQVYDFNINSTQRFTLPKDYSIELTGLYMSPSNFGTARLKPIYQVDAGFQKKFPNKKDILRFAANDMFNSGGNFRYVEHLPIPGAVIRGSINFGMVAFKLTYTHNFGNKALNGKRDRSTGAEDELKRVHN
jgi:hypothetical protein